MYENYSEAISAYNDYLNEFSTVDIAGQDFAASVVLFTLDPIAYRVGFFDWLDGEGVDSDDLDDEGYEDLP